MMKRILCLLAAALLCLILPAAAEENVNVVTAAELDELLESVRAQVLTEELLNDPAGEDAEIGRSGYKNTAIYRFKQFQAENR